MAFKINAWITVAVLCYSAHLIACGECPAQEVLTPCTCENGAIIRCGGSEAYSLSKKFDQIHTYLAAFNSQARMFDAFYLQNPEITRIEDNVFSDIEFRRIYFTNVTKLASISSRAFASTSLPILEFRISGDNQLGSIPDYDRSLFDALSTLINARVIVIDNHKLTAIPAHAFESIDGEQISLTELKFVDRAAQLSIKSIGDYAFYELPQLLQISLNNQKIDRITRHAFNLRIGSDEMLEIYLQNNELTANSFEVGAFLGISRPVRLDLSRNAKLDSLHKPIFEPFLALDARNTIILTGNKLQCDCSTYWLMEKKELFDNNQVIDAVCNSTGKAMQAFNLTSIKC